MISDDVKKCIRNIWDNPTRHYSIRPTSKVLSLNDALHKEWFGPKQRFCAIKEIAQLLHELEESQLTQQNFKREDVFVTRKKRVIINEI